MEEGRATGRGYVVFFSAISLVVGAGIMYLTLRPWKDNVPITISTPPPTATLLPTPTPSPLRIHVSGAVRNPNVYQLPPGTIARAAIEAAGGALSDADLSHLNLALELRDQQQVYVPHEGETNPPPPVSGGASESEGTASGPININTASARELETLPGIGEVTAQRIIDYREANGPFATIEDIQNVSGIGLKTFEAVKDLIMVPQ